MGHVTEKKFLYQIYGSFKILKASELILSVGKDFRLSALRWNLLENAIGASPETYSFFSWVIIRNASPLYFVRFGNLSI